MKLSCYINQHKESDTDIRLGQLFCNDYVHHEWEELFYEESDEAAVEMITNYLIEMHTYPLLPHKVGDTF